MDVRTWVIGGSKGIHLKGFISKFMWQYTLYWWLRLWGDKLLVIVMHKYICIYICSCSNIWSMERAKADQGRAGRN